MTRNRSARMMRHPRGAPGWPAWVGESLTLLGYCASLYAVSMLGYAVGIVG